MAAPLSPIPPQLLESARAEFLEKGFAAANVARIAAAAGMSKKTVYRYVASKDELLVAVLQSVIVDAGLAPSFTPSSLEPVAFLTGHLQLYAALAFSDQGVTSYRVLLTECSRFPEFALRYNDTIRAFVVDPLAKQLALYVEQGKLHLPDPTQAAYMLLSMVDSRALREAMLGIAPTPIGAEFDALVDNAVSLFLNGAWNARDTANAPMLSAS